MSLIINLRYIYTSFSSHSRRPTVSSIEGYGLIRVIDEVPKVLDDVLGDEVMAATGVDNPFLYIRLTPPS